MTRRHLGRVAALFFGLAAFGAQAGAPLISIVIDDLGDSWAEGRAAIGLPGAVACAFLPESPHTPRLAGLAHAAGKEVLVHLPLEPSAGAVHPLALRMQEPAVLRSGALERLLAAVPHAVGVNNHQGSRATASRGTMHWLMRELSQRGTAYFIDSMTTPESVAYPMARAYGIPATRRRVFLDHERGAQATRREFSRLIELARRTGGALAIGHPYPETLAVLSELLPQLDRLGVSLVAPSQLISNTEQRLLVPPVVLRMATTLSAGQP
ncbi:MAG: divergent polysaccharide deacetylase family protein [Gammaproteobacteria bacterium]